MSARQARAVRRRKGHPWAVRGAAALEDQRRRLGWRRRDVRRLATLPRWGIYVVRLGGRRWRVQCLPWRVQVYAPGYPSFPRTCRAPALTR